MRTLKELKMLQALPLDIKIAKTQARTREWVQYYGIDGVYVSFSGGKDSTVLLDIARKIYPNIEAVFVDTGLEYPEIRKFVKTFDNLTILRPKMRFDEVIKQYGYPFIGKEASERIANAKKCLAGGGQHTLNTIMNSPKSYPVKVQQLVGAYPSKKYDFSKWKPLLNVDFNISNMCCNVMKKQPLQIYNKENNKFPMTAQMAEESQLRTTQWLKVGCNGFDMKSPISNPMSFWTEQDILQYIRENNLPLSRVYGDIVYCDKNGMKYQEMLCECGSKLCTTGCSRTGCIFCGFGCHLEKGESRFQMLKRTHTKHYNYCMNGGEYNEQGVWQPNEKGLGMKHCIDVINSIYGKDFIKY